MLTNALVNDVFEHLQANIKGSQGCMSTALVKWPGMHYIHSSKTPLHILVFTEFILFYYILICNLYSVH